MIALALSGGGSRAIAFHLGCLRALNQRGVLPKVSVLSAVSGGSVIAGMYAYSRDGFADFDRRVVTLLRSGLHKAATRHLLSLELLPRIVATNVISRPASYLANLLGQQPPLRRWASRTDALEAALKDIFGKLQLPEVARDGLDVVFNACELRTGTAFRFGNRRSGTWRLGEIRENHIPIAHAIACSAAYPLYLPAFDREYSFIKDGVVQKHRVIITDGGIYDNLGLSCVEPGRNYKYTLHNYSADYIVCCHAGYGQFSGKMIPFGFLSRITASFDSVFRKVQMVCQS